MCVCVGGCCCEDACMYTCVCGEGGELLNCEACMFAILL